MKHLGNATIAAFLCCAGSASQAAVLDLSKPFLCATVEALSCSAGNGCTRGTPDQIGAPDFMRIDLAKKVVIGAKRTTPIRLIEQNPEHTLLQGTEMGFAWTLALDPQGKLTGTLADQKGAFVLFGSCTTP